MISKRTLMAGSGASLALLAAGAGPRAESPKGDLPEALATLRLEAARRLLAPDRTVEVLRLAASLPVVRVRKGQAVRLALQNSLAEVTSLQVDGLRGLGSLDDESMAATRHVPAGQSRSMIVTPLDSGTAWFHPAPGTLNQTARGARGILVVEEADAPSVDQDLVIVMADWLLSADGQLQFGSTAPLAATSTVFTVNGEPSPAGLTAEPGSRLRLRLINASTQRVMLVACEGARPLILAIDGQPSELFEPVRRTLPIGPGARYDVMLDCPATVDARIEFTLKATEMVGGVMEPDRPLMVIRTAGIAKDPRPPIAALKPNPALPRQIPLEASKRADLVIEGRPGSPSNAPSGWTVNGISGLTPGKPVLSVRQGDAVTFGLVNKAAATVPLRFAGQAVRLLHAKDDGWEPYWRDAVLLPPQSRNHVAFVASTPGRWPIESGFDDLTLAGLRCWFEVKPT